MAKKRDTSSIVAPAAVGLVAAAAAGYYFYASEDAKKHRRIAAKWTNGLKRDVIKQARKLKDVDAASIARSVDNAIVAYEGVRSVSREDVKAAAAELKANWERIRAEAIRSRSQTKRRIRKTIIKKPKRKSRRST